MNTVNSEKSIKIALADFRHITIGRHSVYIPLGIASIASFLLSKIGEERLDLRLYTEIDEFLEDVENNWIPDIAGFSSYCWNTEVSLQMLRYIKSKSPQTISVMGGPDFPNETGQIQSYMKKHTEIDFYITSDGEFPFAEIVEKYIESSFSIDELKEKEILGTVTVYNDSVFIRDPYPFVKNLDIIPSPFEAGLLDKWLDQDFMPAIQTNRGCPFKCGYCHTGQNLNKIAFFSLERVKKDLSYIIDKVKGTVQNRLCIFDTNFGMYPQDLEIAKYLRSLMDEYDWPQSIEIENAKENISRVMEIEDLLNNRANVSLSRQSINQATCDVIKRTNLQMEDYLRLKEELTKRGHKPTCELIIPLPEESKKSYLEGEKKMIEAGVFTSTYTAIMLKATFLGSAEMRSKYDMKTKYRIVPMAFGEYAGEKCFETEEVCIATSTMSYEDYLECRGFSLISNLFTWMQLDIFQRHVEDLGLSFFDYINELFSMTINEDICLSEVYNGFLQEMHEELFDSPEDIMRNFSIEKNYRALIAGELGCNLLKKYIAKLLYLDWKELVELAYSVLEKIAGDKLTAEVALSLNDAKKWMIEMRDLKKTLNPESWDKCNVENYSYDVNLWYNEKQKKVKLTDYAHSLQYQISYDIEKVSPQFELINKLYGEDIETQLGYIMWRGWNCADFWCECKTMKN